MCSVYLNTCLSVILLNSTNHSLFSFSYTSGRMFTNNKMRVKVLATVTVYQAQKKDHGTFVLVIVWVNQQKRQVLSGPIFLQYPPITAQDRLTGWSTAGLRPVGWAARKTPAAARPPSVTFTQILFLLALRVRNHECRQSDRF